MRYFLAATAVILPLMFLPGCDSFGDQISRQSESAQGQEKDVASSSAPSSPEQEEQTPPPETVREALSGTAELSRFWGAMVSLGIDTAVNEGDGVTVFAPSNQAFADLGEERWAALLADTQSLERLLRYHWVKDASWNVDEVADLAVDVTVEAASGDQLVFSQVGSQLHVNTALLTSRQLITNDGVVHIVDQALIPPAQPPANSDLPSLATLIQQDERLELFSHMAEEGDVMSTFEGEGPFTVFAMTGTGYLETGGELLLVSISRSSPENHEAMILDYTLSGEVLTSLSLYERNGSTFRSDTGTELRAKIEDGMFLLNGARLIQSDIFASNGVLHILGSLSEGDPE